MTKKKENTRMKFLIPVISIFLIIFIFGCAQLKSKKPWDELELSSNVTDFVTVDGEIVAYTYNNFDFVKKDGAWYTEVQPELINEPYIVPFRYGPIEVEDIEIEFLPNDFARYTKPFSKVYITFDHNSSGGSYIVVAAINLVSNMKGGWLVNSSRACIEESVLCENVPVVTCDSHPKNAVIQLIEDEETKILYEDNCLTIWASKNDFIRAAEKIILNWYGIM
ncbi:hypothetical protein GOV08_00245 [Candidatus Woesearchaeota archaeon]|nr:hypothetical protein [Candidatus Woesearchaeota archaeon]